ncbi:hypothetical protein OD91_0488 [Lutibacter sp. Hel_I_33_5]|uniref:hypothetical protein n=1 Tax=Lutibacter sp. Hel_I_33_5 TaxID=1566289 RepID=UPI0011A68D60|nr:hypothetical protein [Lutibacter sp. Hel_I_33_5]TVZ55242.1 hypothetical protein OD91_0488 [Lutibacter sp. Hel_I_33_5]
MKDVILKYYFPVFGLCLGIIVPMGIMNYDSDKIYELVLSLSILIIILTLLLGTFNYKFGNKIELKRKKRLLKKELFKQFVFKGFVNNEVSVSGYFNNYFIIISPEKDRVQPRKWIEIVLLFNPKQQNQFIPNYIFEKLYKINKKNYTWNSNILTINIIYGIKMPSYNRIKKSIEEATQILKNNNIEPILLKDWELSTDESVKYYNQVSKLKKY